MTDYRKTDVIGLFQSGVPKDIGWAMATMHEDMTVTRACKGCNVTSRDPIDPLTKRISGVFHHRPACPVMDRLEALGSDGGSVAS